MPGRSIRVRLLTVAAALLVCFAVPVRASALGPAGVPEDHELITLAQGVLAEIGQIRYDREPLAEELDAVARDRAKLDTKRLRARYFELLKEIYAGFGPERNALHRLAQLLPALEERIQRREEEAGTPEPGEEAVYAAQHVPVMRRAGRGGPQDHPWRRPREPGDRLLAHAGG